jgi:hypothetical protein
MCVPGLILSEYLRRKTTAKALVMSSCWGVADDLADEFEKVKFRPDIVFGAYRP